MNSSKGVLSGRKEFEKLSNIFDNLQQYIVENDWKGACHITTLILTFAALDLKFDAKPCIGEVKAGNVKFDHSWLEIDGKIYDASIIRPLVHSPFSSVYNSIDLNTKIQTALEYSFIQDADRFGIAKQIVSKSIFDYASEFPNGFDKVMSNIVRPHIPKTTIAAYREKYSDLKWKVA